MYFIARKLWFVTYVAVWVIVMAAFLSNRPLWVLIPVSVAALAFVGFTEPMPRSNAATYSANCDCPRCRHTRARHTRRSTDLKDVG